MQINNWSDLLANKRLSKTVRDENNDLIILGTQTKATFKKQDQWQSYAMSVADLAAAIGGGGGGVSFALEAGNFIQIEENGDPRTSSFIPAEDSLITIGAISIPNGLRWRGAFDLPTTGATFEINDVVYTNLGSPTLYTTWFALQEQNVSGAVAPPETGYNNDYWAQLGVQGPKGTDGIDGSSGVANIRTVTETGNIIANGSPGTNSNDRGALILVNSASDVVLSIPVDLNTSNTNGFPGKYQVSIMKIGSGKVTIDGAAVTMLSANNMNVLRAQYSAATLIRDNTDTNTWYLFGDLTNIPA